MDETRFGFILMESPFINTADIERCLAIQAESEEKKPIGQVLLEEGLITPALLDQALAIQESRRKRIKRCEVGVKLPKELELPLVDELIARAAEHHAIDLFLSIGRPPRARIGGHVEHLSTVKVDRDWMRRLVQRLLDRNEIQQFDSSKDSITIYRKEELGPPCRATLFKDSRGPAASVRLFRQPVPSLEDLGHTSGVARLPSLGRGLLVIAGGVESGKSTTIASLCQHLAREFAGHVLVIQDKQACDFHNGAALVTRRLIGRDCDHLEAAIRASFREDPDILVIDELDGHRNTDMALQAAAANRLVIAGVRAPNAYAAIEKLQRGVPEYDLEHFRSRIAGNLLGIVYQELVPTKKRDNYVLAEAVLPNSKSLSTAIETGNFDGMNMLPPRDNAQGSLYFDDSLERLVEEGVISIDEAYTRARDKQRLLMKTIN